MIIVLNNETEVEGKTAKRCIRMLCVKKMKKKKKPAPKSIQFIRAFIVDHSRFHQTCSDLRITQFIICPTELWSRGVFRG